MTSMNRRRSIAVTVTTTVALACAALTVVPGPARALVALDPPAATPSAPSEGADLQSATGRAAANAAEEEFDALLAEAEDTAAEQVDEETATRQALARKAGPTSLATSSTMAETGSVTQGKTGNGDYSATPLAPSASWSAGGSAGSFGWSYPFDAPAAAAGPRPALGVNYDSGSVDGRTFTTNNQPSVIGEGFDLTSSYIERRYISCSDDGHPAKFDLCWRGEHLSLVLNGAANELVQVGDTDVFRLKQDDGSTVQRLRGAENGIRNGEHWQLVTPDGTEYLFGRNQLPGWNAGDPETKSAWTVPVVTNDANDPAQAQVCKEDGYPLATSWCDQGWRWNLDLVTDTNNNAASYWYTAETNRYARNANTDNKTEYVRGGYLNRVDYGLRRDSLFSGFDLTKAPYRLKLDYAERCVVGACENLTKATKSKWPDVPFDSVCEPGDTCKDDYAPTFFSRKMLTNVTSAVSIAGGYRNIDEWSLDHIFINPGDTGDSSDHILWPTRINHTAVASTPHIASRPVRLMPTLDEAMSNRVDRTGDDISPLIRPRLSRVVSDTGAVTRVEYSARDCTTGNLPVSVANNQRRCFPVWWAPNGGDRDKDWFHKYVVNSVTETDTTTGEAVVTSYEYQGAPGWHYNDDPFTANTYRTWSQWRGYERVNTLVGNPDSAKRTLSTTVFMRGMDGDRSADGGTRNVQVAGINADPLDDKEALAGSVRETVLYDGRNRDGSNGAQLSGTITTPVVLDSRASHTFAAGNIDGKAADAVTIRSTIVRTKTTTDRVRVTSGSTPYFRSKVNNVVEFDALGYPKQVENYAKPDDSLAATTDRTCTTRWYARNTDAGILAAPARTQVLATACTNADSAVLPTDAATPGDVISDTAFRYDGASAWAGQQPTRSNLTWTGRAAGYAADRTPSFQATVTTTYDSLGRSTSTTRGEATATTDYQPSGAGVPVSSTQTNAKGHAVTTTYDPAFAVDTLAIDANGRRIEKAYDAAGRLTEVWTPNVNRAVGAPPTVKFGYRIGGDRDEFGYVTGSWISTSRPKGDTSGYVTDYEIFDALLRPRQTQTPSVSGGRLITDTNYNDRGLVDQSFTDVWDDETGPNGTRWVVSAGGFLQDDTTYDGANRPIAVKSSWGLTQVSPSGSTRGNQTTTTSYSGDTTAIEPPAGALGTRVITDALGRVTERRTYPTAAATGATYLWNRFSYDKQQRLKTLTAVDNTQWTYTYDLFGRQVRATDPDRGATTTTYDALDRVRSTTDAENRTLSYSYDDLDRKTGLFSTNTQTPANQLAEWTYDTLTNGKGLPAASIRYVGGKATGSAYTKAVAAYDSMARPIRTTLNLPANEPLVTGPPAGNGARVAATMEFSTSFNRDGTVKTTTEPAVPGLAAEVASYGYDATGLGLPTTLSGVSSLVQNSSYSAFGDLTQSTLGLSASNNNKVWLTYSYDSRRRLEYFYTTENGAANHLIDAKYTYNDVNQVTAIDDLAVADPDYQCFTYGTYQRLENAWTPKTRNCAATGRVKTNIGGKAPYWNSYTYNANGTRATSTKQPVTSTGVATATNYAYGGACTNGTTATTAGAHTLTKTETRVGTATADVDLFCPNRVGDHATSVAPNDATRTATWDAEGKLATLTQGTTKYTHIYDADGNLLIKRPTGNTAGITTLYLGATEIRVTKSTAATPVYTAKSFRYYTHAAGTVGYRLGVPGVASKLYFQAADHHATTSAQWEATNPATTRTKRYTDPFGATRGTAPTGWVDDKRFLGKSHDDTTGITHVAAREYDPALGQFLSVDPILDVGDPQSLNGYSYSNNNPLNLSDPTGMVFDNDDVEVAANTSAGPSAPASTTSSAPTGTTSTPSSTSTQSAPTYGSAGKVYITGQGYVDQEYAASYDPCAMTTRCNSTEVSPLVVAAGKLVFDGSACDTFSWGCIAEIAMVIPFAKIGKAGKLPGLIDDLADGSRATDNTVDGGRAADEVADAADSGSSATTGARSCLKSFVGETLVLMADGSKRPIGSIKVGDRVVATDPETGERVVRRVTRVWVHDDHVLDLAIEGETITTTADHLFWSVTDQRFERADQLAAGEVVLGDLGRGSIVLGFRSGTERSEKAYNLSIAGVHTYHVGEASILVHNDCGYRPSGGFADSDLDEVAQSVYQHVGAGDVPGRPNLTQIHEALTRGVPKALGQGDGGIAQVINYRGVRVIINEDSPWKSTAYFPGGG
ncbi:RHS repeat-associated core domain-containing protein [Nocardioides sp. 1609]|uniref:RHS repeat-associated core domain-containing protein n=1 Tax=Nocardioides sp. 1609 TaxID=2508327 RepID=UPI00142FAED2|nr:RHS repeat-associated core domain-containing protein [Nocardioides sp. 1609]